MVMVVNDVNDGLAVGGPGEALDRLNREVLSGKSASYYDDNDIIDDDGMTSESIGKKKGKEKNNDDNDDNLFATLIDQNPDSSNAGNVLAIILPLALASSLAISYLFISLVTDSFGGDDSIASSSDDIWKSVVQPLLSYLPFLSSLPSVLLCLLFMATEFRWVLSDSKISSKAVESSLVSESSQDSKDGSSSSTLSLVSTPDSSVLSAGNILALIYVVGAYTAKVYPTITLPGINSNIDLWPLQNGVNIALATTVTRVLAPFLIPFPFSSSSSSPKNNENSPNNKSIRTVALATMAVTMFDAIAVFGTVVNAASTTIGDVIAANSASSMSVMEAVARSKLALVGASPLPGSSPSGVISLWQPGLLEIILGRDGNARITEALGLGDIVFPACLVAWALVADNVAIINNGSDLSDSDGDEESTDGINCRGYDYTKASVIGYLIGSFFTEIVGSFSLLGRVSGLPALVFLIPSMLSSVTLMALRRGEMEDVWGNGGGEDGPEDEGVRENEQI